MELILNATPIIYLCKTELHSICNKLDIKFITTPEVSKEVLVTNFPEYQTVTEFISKKVDVTGVDISKEFSGSELDLGEASVLSLAKKLKIPVIIDDKVGRAYAIANNIEVFYTTFFIFIALKQNKLTKKEALMHLDKLIFAGWRCDIETYLRIKNRIETF